MSRVSNSEKRKLMMRSTGNFSVIEENIIAPTPRKYPNLACSPRIPRPRDRERNERKVKVERGYPSTNIIIAENAFKEAGAEIQNILFQKNSEASATGRGSTGSPLVLTSNILRPIVTAAPLRASNPITMNEYFAEANPRPSRSEMNSRVYPHNQVSNRRERNSKKELNRARSFSWPGIPTNHSASSKTQKVAQKV